MQENIKLENINIFDIFILPEKKRKFILTPIYRGLDLMSVDEILNVYKETQRERPDLIKAIDKLFDYYLEDHYLPNKDYDMNDPLRIGLIKLRISLAIDDCELSEFRQEMAKEIPSPISTEDKIKSIQDDFKNLPITYRVSHMSASRLIANQ